MKNKILFLFIVILLAFNAKAQHFGNALDFDGLNNSVSCGNIGNVQTVEFFVNPGTTTEGLIDLDGGTHFINIAAGTISATGFAAPTIYVDGVVSSTIVSGSWQHIAVTTATPFAANAVTLGFDGTSYLTGSMDEVRFWDFARTGVDILSDKNAYISNAHPQWANLIAYYRLDQGQAGFDNNPLPNEVLDYSGHCKTGALNGPFTLSGATSNWVSTGNAGAPILTTTAAGAISYNSAVMNGMIFAQGSSAIATRGFEYATDACFTSNLQTISEAATTTGNYSLTPTTLGCNTTYYYRAFAINGTEKSYGETQNFTTTAFTPLGNTLDFLGTNSDFVSCGNIGNVNTIEFWVKPNTTTEDLIDFDGGIHKITVTGGTISATGFASPVIYVNGLVSSTLVAGVWQQIAITDASAVSASAFNIGKATTYFTGMIDELRLWNTVQTQANIQANMYRYLAGNEAGLVAYYRFDEGLAGVDNTTATGKDITTLYDYKGCYNGTLNGTVSGTFALNGPTSNWVNPGNQAAPIIKTINSQTFISYSSAGLTQEILAIGGSNITTIGFECATDACFTTGLVSGQQTVNLNSTGTPNVTVSGLTPNTAYFYRAYAINSSGKTYAETRTFTTTNDAPPGTCINFIGGSSQYVDCGILIGNINTVEFWVNLSTTTESVIDFDGGTHTVSIAAGTISANGFNSPTIYVNGIVSSTVVAGKWQHIAITTTTQFNANAVKIGNIGAVYLTGLIEELRLWNNVRTQEEIQNYMCRTIENPAGETNLVAYYQMDNGVGASLTDLKGTNTGTLINGPTWANSDAFNVWMGSTNSTWATATNWSDVDGIPGAANSGINVHITPGNSPVTAGNLTLENIVVENGGTFTVTAPDLLTVNSNLLLLGTANIAASTGADPGKVTVTGDLYMGTSGILNLKTPTNAKPSGSLITNGSVLGTGTINAERYYNVNGRYQFVGSPMNNSNSNLFTKASVPYFNKNFYWYDEGFKGPDPSTANYSEWNAAGFNGMWQYAHNNDGGTVPVTMNVGQGYASYVDKNITVTYTGTASNLSTGDKNIGVTYTLNDNANTFGNLYDGWNLISNPFPSAVDWNGAGIVKTDVDNTVYFYNGANYVYYSGDASQITGIGQTLNADANAQFIPPYQGFFVHANATGSVTLANTARIHGSVSMFKGGEEKPQFPYLKLKTTYNDLTDEALIRFLATATNSYDGSFDGYKSFLQDGDLPQLYSTDTKSIGYAINSLPEMKYKDLKVPVGLLAKADGKYTFTASEINTGDYKWDFVDYVAGTRTPIQTGFTYSATLTKDLYEGRFAVVLHNDLGLDNSENPDNSSSVSEQESDKSINIYPNPSEGVLYISTKEVYNIQISDILGKTVYTDKPGKTDYMINLENLTSGIYIVKFTNGTQSYSKRVVIK